jgi:hypothetical protein
MGEIPNFPLVGVKVDEQPSFVFVEFVREENDLLVLWLAVK